MKCIQCGCDTYTISTRDRQSLYVHRRKECPTCGTRFSTYEFTGDVMQQIVSIMDGKKNMISQIQKCLPRFSKKDGKGEKAVAFAKKMMQSNG